MRLGNKINRFKGRKHSEETKKKMSDAHKGKIIPEEIRKKISIALKGKMFSEEHKRKLSENHADFSGENHPGYGRTHICTEEAKRRMSEAQKGRKHSVKTKKKISDAMKINNPMFNLETRKKVSETRKRLKINGSKIWNWKGGASSKNRKIRDSFEYNEWRKSVFKRDNYTCQKCGKKSKKGEYAYLTVHHIKQFAQYPELRFDINNGLTLCLNCHSEETSHEMLKNRSGKRRHG